MVRDTDPMSWEDFIADAPKCIRTKLVRIICDALSLHNIDSQEYGKVVAAADTIAKEFDLD